MSTKRDAVLVEPPPISTLTAGTDRLAERLLAAHSDRGTVAPELPQPETPHRPRPAAQPSLELVQARARAAGMRVRV